MIARTKTGVTRLLLYSLLLCGVFPGVGYCQSLDDLATKVKAIFTDLQLTPEQMAQVEDKATKGDAQAQFVMGWICFAGPNGEIDHRKAIDWMTKAANQDYKYSQTHLGLMYLAANDIPDNYSQAKAWLLKGAELGDADAWNGLGVIYFKGLGVEVNGAEAVKYFQKAADAGFDSGEYNLGLQYYAGKLVPQDYKEAARLFKLASDQGHTGATFSLGVMYRDGQGVSQDAAQAVHLFEILADKGFAPAQHNLAASYYSGTGVSTDLVAAYMWANLAADAGLERSQKLLVTLNEKMTPAQVAEAKQRAQDWTRAHADQESQQQADANRRIEARRYLSEGVDAYKATHFDEAIDDLKRAKELDPSLVNARLYLGTAYAALYVPGGPSAENLRNGELALSEFKEVLENDPRNLSAIDGAGAILYNLAGTPFNPQKFAESKSYHEKHIAVAPDAAVPYYWVGVIDWMLVYRFNTDCRAQYNQTAAVPVKQSEPLPPELRSRFAQDYAAMVNEGISNLNKAIERKPDYADAMAYLNLLYRQKADLEPTAAARAEDLRTADDLIDKVKAIKKP